jgi:mannose-6-phosphate isomerase-like protein (cupin superfamily)
MTNPLNIGAVMDGVEELWSPRVVATVDNYDVKVANAAGEFVRHTHETDEFFLVLAGRFRIQLPDELIELRAGDVFTVSRGVPHQPSADEGTRVLLFELRDTPNTGDPATARDVRLVR